MLWMIDNGIHDFKFLLCASIYTCRWGLCDSRLCHAAARRWHGIGQAQSSALGSGDADGAMILSKLRPLMDACELTIVTDPSDIPRIQPGASIES